MPGPNSVLPFLKQSMCILFLKSEIFINQNAYFQDDLKATLTARNREAKQLTQLERTRQRNPSDRHVIVSFDF